jgi:PKD repeat protein
VNLAVTADASGSTDPDATPIASYTFDFGDGSAAVGPQPGATANHTYTRAGTYTVQVTVKDTAGLSSTATKTVAVTDAAPVASLTTSPSSIRSGQSLTANASGSTDTDGTPIATYTFNFGDGTPIVGPQSAPTARHTYTKRGDFTVTVTVRDTAGNASTASKKIKVR